MYERSYGSKYESLGGYVSAADIAKLMRADIKEQVQAGHLPKVTYSVRVDNYSGGRSINIEIRGLSKAWEKVVDHRWGREEVIDKLSVQAAWVERQVKKIWASYNYDGSETQVDYFDVNYYGGVEVESPWHAKYRAEEKARQEAKRLAKAAAPAPEPYRLKPGQPYPHCGRCGAQASVMQIGRQRYFRTDHPRCEGCKRGAVRQIVREEVSA